jgi:hypothetical protein
MTSQEPLFTVEDIPRPVVPAAPLTCGYCQHAPGTCVLIADLSWGRQIHLVCGPCGSANLEAALKLSDGGASAWLLQLATQHDDDEPVPYRMALTEITVRVARTGDRTADIVVTVPSGDEYLSPVTIVVGSCRRSSADEDPEKWKAWLWAAAGGSMHVTQSCNAVERPTLRMLEKALIRCLVKDGAWWT